MYEVKPDDDAERGAADVALGLVFWVTWLARQRLRAGCGDRGQTDENKRCEGEDVEAGWDNGDERRDEENDD
jgi:hypothetical protein